MKFKLPRRQRKSFETISGKPIDTNLNKKEALEIFEMVTAVFQKLNNSTIFCRKYPVARTEK